MQTLSDSIDYANKYMQDWYEQRLLETKNTKRIIDLQK
jgi:hypothetical protein